MDGFTLAIARIPSPAGDIIVVTDQECLLAVEFDDSEVRLDTYLNRQFPRHARLSASDPLGMATRMQGYLAGDMAAFDDASVAPAGTGFQTRVWLALRDIPPGKTETYGQLAARLGKPTASRAIGMANSRNPIAILITLSPGDRRRWLLDRLRRRIGAQNLAPAP